MKLYEFEGHNILKKAGIEVPNFVVVSDIDEVKQARKRLKFPIVAKVQVLSGKRGKSGGVKIATTEGALIKFCREMFGREFAGEEVRFIVLAQKVDIEKELYISITYDTVKKIPFLLFSQKGGVDIEEVDPAEIMRLDIDPLVGPTKSGLSLMRGSTPKDDALIDFAQRLWDVFSRYDCRLVEVNPLAKVKKSVILEGGKRPIGSQDSIATLQDDNFVAVDAKMILDYAGLVRHRDLDVLPKGAVLAIPTEREFLAKQIDREDYRGTAGSKFIEFDGDIAVLASGGGASLMLMDAVLDAGGSPANYTEYSGNPPREKVEKLTKITLSREGLAGCLVAGAVANFTDIFETLSGFVDGLVQVKPKPAYPFVIRRGGPRQAEAYEMLEKVAKKEGFDIHLFGPQTPISVAARKMVELSEQFKVQNAKFKVDGKK